MKKRKAALYDPYLDTLGGGEFHILSIMKLLEEKGYHIDLYWNHDLHADIQEKFGFHFNNLTFKPNLFRSKGKVFQKLDVLKGYDYFFYITDGSFFFSAAKKNFIFAMVPNKKLYLSSFANKIKTFNYKYISNSEFTRSYLQSLGIESKVWYPPLTSSFLSIKPGELKKEPLILSVGRFFAHLHSKRHDVAIDAFKKLQKDVHFKNYKLYIVGGLKNEDEGYYQMLQKKAADNRSIVFKPNISSSDLLDLYKRSSVYWHCAGFDQDETLNPDKVEHLGVSPIEAMAAGAIPFCYNAGGPKELISDDKNGYLFHTIDELILKTKKVVSDEKKQKLLRANGHTFIENNFSASAFEKRMSQIL